VVFRRARELDPLQTMDGTAAALSKRIVTNQQGGCLDLSQFILSVKFTVYRAAPQE
jgi:hypothetical protein